MNERKSKHRYAYMDKSQRQGTEVKYSKMIAEIESKQLKKKPMTVGKTKFREDMLRLMKEKKESQVA
jgi:hypothetical protein